jgi:predicted DNA-binding ribbon-helix-helix protein
MRARIRQGTWRPREPDSNQRSAARRTIREEEMCRVFASQDPDIYKVVTRSVRLNGYCTSIRLESLFWTILDEIAASQGLSTPRFISTLYDEVMELRGEVGNFTSLLRVTCTGFVSGQIGAALREAQDEIAAPRRSKRIPPSPSVSA